MSNDQVIIDTDAHVIEPPDVFTARMSKAQRGDLVQRVEWREETLSDGTTAGAEMWIIGSEPVS